MIDGLRSRDIKTVDLNVNGTATGIGAPMTQGNTWYVDGTNGATTFDGTTWGTAFSTIQLAVTAASAGDVIYVAAKDITDTTGDPTSYAETIIIPLATSNLAIIGVSRGRTQGGLPQIKMGSGSTALITIRAPGCLIANIGINGVSSTGGGILLDDDYSTKSAFGTSIINCHIKNCVGTTANNAATGGGIMWTTAGNAWQVLISGCRFYRNVGDIVMPGTGNTVPQDVVIENCVFSGPASVTDCNIFVAASGINGVTVRNCDFQQLPALGGTNDRFIKMGTGTVGIIVGCTFAAQANPTGGTIKTWKASGTAADFPTTVHMMGCYGQTIKNDESAEISIE